MKIDDVISRQAALDALEKAQYSSDFCREHHIDYSISMEMVRIVLHDLPPVTPQYTEAEIQKMQDLEFAEIQKAYEIGKAEKPNKWIPVSERLPEENKRVLVSDVMGIYIGEFVDAEENWGGKHFINEHGMHSKSVIAWMPLPEPYTEGGTQYDD